jgi:hypothetical protein
MKWLILSGLSHFLKLPRRVKGCAATAPLRSVAGRVSRVGHRDRVGAIGTVSLVGAIG